MVASFSSNLIFNNLNVFTSGILSCSTVSKYNYSGILSTPCDLLSFIFLIVLATIAGVGYNCIKVPMILLLQLCKS